MKTQTYAVKGHKTPPDVVADNVETLETGYTLDMAKAAAISYQKNLGYTCAWIEEEESQDSPRITRCVEQDRTGVKYSVTYCDGWAV
jgi:hypothetical protein